MPSQNQRMNEPEIVAVCACGRSFTGPEWIALPYVGLLADDAERIELRNCPCRSTRGVSLSMETAPRPLSPREVFLARDECAACGGLGAVMGDAELTRCPCVRRVGIVWTVSRPSLQSPK